LNRIGEEEGGDGCLDDCLEALLTLADIGESIFCKLETRRFNYSI